MCGLVANRIITMFGYRKASSTYGRQLLLSNQQYYNSGKRRRGCKVVGAKAMRSSHYGRHPCDRTGKIQCTHQKAEIWPVMYKISVSVD